ncbi:aldo/keto reductase [Algiphilus aromaticivorans]|uniref:aldo/keto reductase n=1 Tax=Algiphilus aromaticivorans TaxID=382454 RepID=UPI0005C1FE83|nr:aldo/keto reductase [Algiphilus aromaticivorans]
MSNLLPPVKAAGATIPALGFGTFELAPEEAGPAVHAALEAGYRHIDTAQIYRNEAAVGEAVAASPVPRADIFLTTKVWIDHFRDGDLQASVADSLQRLRVDAVDLLLLHWPNPEVPLSETLGALLDAQARGLTRHIGISNFPSPLMREAAAVAPGRIATNQVEYHPFLSQRAVLATARELGMSVTAYSPLARGQVFGDPVLKRIGDAHGKNEGQVAIRWLLDQGVAVLPRSKSAAHIRDNLAVDDCVLTETEHAAIAEQLAKDRRLINPRFAPDWDSD